MISKTSPLKIRIFIDDKEQIVVENELKLKTVAKNSTKTGLENVRKRYAYLSDQSIDVFQNQEIFKVSVPLISFEGEL